MSTSTTSTSADDQPVSKAQPQNTLLALRELFGHVSPRRRRQLGPVLALMLLGAFAELISLGAILPFLTVVSNPEQTIAHPSLRPFLEFFGLVTPTPLVIAAAALFGVSAVVAAGTRLLLVWGSQKFVFGIAQELSSLVYHRTLHQPYSYHTEHNSSQTLAAINKALMLTTGLLLPIMQAVSAAVIAVFILIGLLFVDVFVALASALGFSIIYLAVIRFTRKRMRYNGQIIAKAQKDRVQAANEGLGGIRDVLLNRSQNVFIERFVNVEKSLRQAQAANSLIGQSPRFVVEGLGLALIAVIAVFLSLRDGGLVGALPILGALALGAQRLLPLVQQVFTGWSAAMTNSQVLNDVLDIVCLPEAAYFQTNDTASKLQFTESIRLENVRFSYPRTGYAALENINLIVPRGARVGLVGKTGSGKSTLMDLILGLLAPDSGKILIDDTELTDSNRMAWQSRIAHVPQAIYLSDASIAENIAFGITKDSINMARVERAAAEAELSDVIGNLPERYQSFVGERGVRLSGGQRQRIGIARALYKQADVLVFDEATSALDTETEGSIMNTVNNLSTTVTVFMISHRPSTLVNCDAVYSLNNRTLQIVTE